MIGVSRFNSRLWEMYMQRPPEIPRIPLSAVGRFRDDFLEFELRPSSHGQYAGAIVSTNRWGMRDHDFSLDKPAGTSRIAMLGASHVMGWGVGDEEGFVALLGRRLVQTTLTEETRIEVMNFAVAAYTLLQQIVLLHDVVNRFHPDVAVIAIHAVDPGKAI